MTGQIKNIMCVDDDGDILDVARMCLETVAGYTVHGCGSGADMLATIHKIFPDLVLLDVMMPEMDGPATLKLMRQNPALDRIPVVFLTARVQPDEVEQYMRMGAAGVIPKPFDPMELSGQVAEIYGRFHARPERAAGSA